MLTKMYLKKVACCCHLTAILRNRDTAKHNFLHRDYCDDYIKCIKTHQKYFHYWVTLSYLILNRIVASFDGPYFQFIRISRNRRDFEAWWYGSNHSACVVFLLPVWFFFCYFARAGPRFLQQASKSDRLFGEGGQPCRNFAVSRQEYGIMETLSQTVWRTTWLAVYLPMRRTRFFGSEKPFGDVPNTFLSNYRSSFLLLPLYYHAPLGWNGIVISRILTLLSTLSCCSFTVFCPTLIQWLGPSRWGIKLE